MQSILAKFMKDSVIRAMSHQIHTYAELRHQIHDDLRIQHPEWVERNGESSMRLLELLDTLTRKGIPLTFRKTRTLKAFCNQG
jgi:hypothetical protein